MTTPVSIIFATFAVLLLLRVPIAFVLIASSVVGILLSPMPIGLTSLPTSMWQGINHFVLLSLPFFILMGDLALSSGVTQRLTDWARAFFGHLAGGMAHVSVVVNTVMAGMSGSDLADAAATGKLLIPAMKQSGYPVGYAASVICGAAVIGPLIPPSINFIVFAAATNVSIGRLFLAGAVPGLLLAALLMIQAYFVARRNGYPTLPRVPYRKRISVTIASLPVLLIPILLLGSIVAGVATPTEAAVVGVLAVIVVGGLVYRELTLREFVDQTVLSMKAVGSIFFIIAAAAAFSRVLTLYGAAESVTVWVTGLTRDPIVFLLLVNVFYLALGCFIDTTPILLVVVPLLMPTVLALHIDPVHFGVITVFNLLIGLMTPPYGLTMYLLCRIANISIQEFWKYAWPIFVTLLFALLLITVFPAISLALPELLLPVK
jgi:tripartite ATP-independent transporter DctM subunit